MGRTSLNTISEFLAKKRLAMVGVSRNEKDFSVMLFKELRRRGYDVVPVNPNAAEVSGQPCFANVQNVEPGVDWVLLMTGSAVTESVLRDCAAAGIRKVWFYHAGSADAAVSDGALEFCREHGIEVVPGACPYMFFPKNGLHKVHGWIEKIAGTFPKRSSA